MTHVEYLTYILTEYDENNNKNFLSRVDQLQHEEIRISMIREYQKSISVDPYRNEIQRLLLKAIELSPNPPVMFTDRKNIGAV